MLSAIATVVGGSFERAPWGWGVLVTLLIILSRLRPIMVKLAMEREKTLLQARAADNKRLNARLARMERKLERKEVRHRAERAVDRHRLNNVTQCFDALLMMLEMDPTRAKEAVEKIKDMRARQMIAEAEEKARVHEALLRSDQDDDIDEDDLDEDDLPIEVAAE